MINNVSQKNNTSFGHIKPTIRMGEQVIQEFNQEFPKLYSSTKIASRLSHLEQNKIPHKTRVNLMDLLRNLDMQISNFRASFNGLSYAELMDAMPALVKKHNLANCGEMTLIIQDKMLKKGIECHLISAEVKNKTQERWFSDHVFLATNLKPKANLSKPKTWGNKAVIIDPWLKECSPASKILRKYKLLFSIDEDKDEKLVFKNANFFNVKKYLKSREQNHTSSFFEKFFSLFAGTKSC